MDESTDDAERIIRNHRICPARDPSTSQNSHRRLYLRIAMAVTTEQLAPPNHLPLDSTGLTPSFGSTPGFFSAEFNNLNPFDVDFHDANASPLRIEQPSLGTPPARYSSYPQNTPRSVADIAMRRNYDPSLVLTPGPRMSTTFKPSSLKENLTESESSSRLLLASPQRSPNALNLAFLVDKPNNDFPAPYPIRSATHSGCGSSRGIYGEVTPPTDESRSPRDRDLKSNYKSSSLRQKASSSSNRKRKSDTEEPTSEHEDGSQTNPNNGGGRPSDNKRKKFLERNRLAASKCRQKKKEWANNLEEQARYHAQENKILRASVAQLRDECLYLKNFLLSTHSGCSCVGVKNYLMREAQLSQHVAAMGSAMPIANLSHPSMEMGRVGYPSIMGMHLGIDDRRRSESIGSGITMSDGGGQQGTMSPQQ